MKSIEVAVLNPEVIPSAEKMMVCAARLTQRGHKIKSLDDFMALYGNEFVPYVVLTEKMLSKIQSCTDIYEQVKKMTTNYRVWNNVADYLTECLNIIADKVENAKAQG